MSKSNSVHSLLLSHPTGNANVRAAAHAFYSAGWLSEFDSCLCWNSRNVFAEMLPKSLRKELNRRSFNEIPLCLQQSHPWREIGRLLSVRFSITPFLAHESGFFSADRVFQSFDRSVASALFNNPDLDAVYAYEDSALITFKAAKSLGIKRIYELPIGYWQAARSILQEEAELVPEWSPTLTGLFDSPAKLDRKDAELQHAEMIIVASSFVKKTLDLYKATQLPVHVISYGSPAPVSSSVTPRVKSPLRVLFVGGLSQRKGLSYLLHAVELLGSSVRLTLIGRPSVPDCPALLSAITSHQWIASLPHDQILDQMKQHDVLVFPSLFEGFGLVLTEALSQGLPVIATTNTAAPDLIQHGVEGFIIPIRNSSLIAEYLQFLIDNPDRLLSMRLSCLERATQLAWTSYQRRLTNVVGAFLGNSVYPS